MKPIFRPALASLFAVMLCAPAGAALADAPTKDHPKDYPTMDRVLYVHECMRDHPGMHYEMVSKCSCAFDHLAAKIDYDEYIVLKTASDARTIGGERGSYIRANEEHKQNARRFLQLQKEARKGCFIAGAD